MIFYFCNFIAKRYDFLSLISSVIRRNRFFLSHGIYISQRPFSTISNSFVDKRVEFNHLPFSKDYINKLKSLGINDLKLFQYVIFKTLADDLGRKHDNNLNKRFLRIIFYNELGSGQTIGTLLPLLYIYSLSHSKEFQLDPTLKRPTGSLLILTSRTSFHKVSSLILSINPFLKCLSLEESSNLYSGLGNNSQVGSDFSYNSNGFNIDRVRENLVSDESTYDVIVGSYKTFPKISQRKNRKSFSLLSKVSCVLFDDFSELIEKDSVTDLFKENIKLIRNSKNVHINDSKYTKDFHVVCLTSSIGDRFAEYSRKNLSNYSLYDFKYGTKQRVLSDSRTDVLKVDLDLGECETLNLESGDIPQNNSIEHSICKVSKSQKYERITVLKNLIYSYLDIPTFFNFKSFPLSIKKPSPKFKCIIFVSNRRQMTKLANLQEFSNLCVFLGRHLNVYERAKSISFFNNLSKPIMIATDRSVHGSSFEDVKFIFNFNPPKTKESYKSRISFARKKDSLCITLYSNDQYSNLVSVVKDCVKKVSVHIVPSNEYMLNHDMKWLKKFVHQIVTENKTLISPYLKRTEELLDKYGESVIKICSNILLRDNTEIIGNQDSKDDELISNSILSGRSGFTAVTMSDISGQYLKEDLDVVKLVSRYITDSRITSALGKCYKTEEGYILDVPNKYLKDFIEISRDNPDIYVQVTTKIPKIITKEENNQIGKVHRKGFNWRDVKIRKLPKVEDSNNFIN